MEHSVALRKIGGTMHDELDDTFKLVLSYF